MNLPPGPYSWRHRTRAHGLLAAWLLLLAVAVLAAYQDATGRLLRVAVEVKPRQFKEQEGLAYRCAVPQLAELPERLRDAVIVREDGWELERSIARVVQGEGGGAFAWTRKTFFIAPSAPGDPRLGHARYDVLMPRVLGDWQRGFFYLPPILMLVAAGLAAPWRERLAASLLKLFERLLN